MFLGLNVTIRNRTHSCEFYSSFGVAVIGLVKPNRARMRVLLKIFCEVKLRLFGGLRGNVVWLEKNSSPVSFGFR